MFSFRLYLHATDKQSRHHFVVSSEASGACLVQLVTFVQYFRPMPSWLNPETDQTFAPQQRDTTTSAVHTDEAGKHTYLRFKL